MQKSELSKKKTFLKINFANDLKEWIGHSQRTTLLQL